MADTSLHSEFESDVLDKIDAESFLKTLNPRDRQIFELKKQGLTDKEIAEKVGFANHSAVVKRRKQIARQYLQYAERNAE